MRTRSTPRKDGKHETSTEKTSATADKASLKTRLLWRMIHIGRRWLPNPVKDLIKVLLGPYRSHFFPAPRLVMSNRLIADAQNLMAQVFLTRNPQVDVLVLPVIDWDFRCQRPQHLARQFAKNGHRVFYVKTSFGPAEAVEDKEYTPAVRLPEKNIAEVELPGPPNLNLYQHQATDEAVQLWLRALERLGVDYGIVEAICLVQLPFWKPLALALQNRLGWKLVYDCMDKHSGFSTNNANMVEEEESLSRGCDLVITTARALFEDQKSLNSNCLLVPNACQFEHFSTSFGRTPDALADLPAPIIGYYGAISDWFDSELVAEVARRRPDWSFVLIGSTYGARLEPFQGLKNVHLLGEQPYRILPTYLLAFDVCLIPFKITPLTEATNPVKFFEYLSAGKPVVSVPLPELLPYGRDEGLVYLAATTAETVKAIDTALHVNRPELAALRQQVAQQNTWEERFARMNQGLRGLYKRASIVLLTYNNLNLNRLCIDSIYRNTVWPDFELIVVDNASTDGTREYLRKLELQYDNIKVILNDKNQGFAGGNNQGIRAAAGEYVVLLNNDTMVTRGWLGRLIRHLERDPGIGMIGPVTNNIANEAKIEVDYSSLEEMEHFAEQRAWEFAGQTFPINVLALFCAASRRRLFEEVGLLDERFEVGMFEDDDLALRIRQAGYRIVCAQDAFIHHFQCEGFKLLGKQAYLQIFEANRARFEKKWNVSWEQHRQERIAG